MSAVHRLVGIVAGGGSLPREIAEHVVAHGGAVHIVAIAGEADDDLSKFPVTVVGWGQIARILNALKVAGCTELVIVGGVRRPDLSTLRLDLGFLLNLPAILRIIASGGDDSLLTRVVHFFEQKGFKVVAPGAVMPELLVGKGPLGSLQAQEEDAADIALGFDIVRALGPHDVGQAVIVSGGCAEAIEGAEGTDAMLDRTALQRRRDGGLGAKPHGVLIKRPKPGQELRIDLPAIGPGTLMRAAEAGLAGIAVLAGGAIAAERGELIRRADEAGLFVEGAEDPRAGRPHRLPPPQEWRFESLGGPAPTAPQRADAAEGAAVLAALASLAPSLGVVVARRHVLAVEAGEGTAALLERTGGLRQWGRRRSSRRAATTVLAPGVDPGPIVAGAAAAGLAGLALVGQPSGAIERAAEVADRLGLFLATLVPTRGKHEGES